MATMPEYDQSVVTREEADAAKERLQYKALIQLEVLREDTFFQVMDAGTPLKDKLAFMDQLAKSTPLESMHKRVENTQPVFQFGFAFQRPDGQIKTVGAVLDGSLPQDPAPALLVSPVATFADLDLPVLEGE